jgi:primosomal protein N' (replication factor Y)
MSDWVVSVAIPRPLDQLFTYRVPLDLQERICPGQLVRVSFGRDRVYGFVAHKPIPLESAQLAQGTKLKEIEQIIDEDPAIKGDVATLCQWAHEYYQAPLGEVLNSAAPHAALGLKAKKTRQKKSKVPPLTPRVVALSVQQQSAIEAILQSKKPVSLLQGVTGSGKTEVYLELARRCLAQGRSVLILAPEIALTPQLHERFETGLGSEVGLWHSALPDGQRHEQWLALREGRLRVLIGARSSVFAPIQDLGLIVVDEEHDPSFKQEDRFRYNARDLAIVRAKITSARVILGSATPSLESLENARSDRYQKILLTERHAQARLPEIEIVSLSESPLVMECRSILAEKSLDTLRETLRAGEQAMVFLNRRGFAAFLVCKDCGEVPGCPNCSLSLSVHLRHKKLRCHVCAHQEPLHTLCEKCQSHELEPIGAGTESLEEDLKHLLPESRIMRLDRDLITSASRLEKALNSFKSGESNLLLGTQMLVKGHHFPGVTCVLVILADTLFRWPDFKSAERAYQVLTQVSGRAGRGEKPGRVLLQSYAPEHPVIQVACGKISVDEFLESERDLRAALRYPPFGRLARLRVEAKSSDLAQTQAQEIFESLQSANEHDLDILGPSEAFLERMKGVHRWDLLLKSQAVAVIQRAVLRARHLARTRKITLVVDIDPSGVG